MVARLFYNGFSLSLCVSLPPLTKYRKRLFSNSAFVRLDKYPHSSLTRLENIFWNENIFIVPFPNLKKKGKGETTKVLWTNSLPFFVSDRFKRYCTSFSRFSVVATEKKYFAPLPILSCAS